MKLFFFSVNEGLAKVICEDLEQKIPKEWGDSIKLWYGSILVKSGWSWSVTGDKDSLKKDILHILEHFCL